MDRFTDADRNADLNRPAEATGKALRRSTQLVAGWKGGYSIRCDPAAITQRFTEFANILIPQGAYSRDLTSGTTKAARKLLDLRGQHSGSMAQCSCLEAGAIDPQPLCGISRLGVEHHLFGAEDRFGDQKALPETPSGLPRTSAPLRTPSPASTLVFIESLTLATAGTVRTLLQVDPKDQAVSFSMECRQGRRNWIFQPLCYRSVHPLRENAKTGDEN